MGIYGGKGVWASMFDSGSHLQLENFGNHVGGVFNPLLNAPKV